MTHAISNGWEHQSLGSTSDLILVLIAIGLTLAITFWNSRRSIAMSDILARMNLDIENLKRRTVYHNACLEMIARELSEHLNEPHS